MSEHSRTLSGKSSSSELFTPKHRNPDERKGQSMARSISRKVSNRQAQPSQGELRYAW